MKIEITIFKIISALFIALIFSNQIRSQVTVISPNGGETWVNNTTATVSFNNQGLADYFEIMISRDNGLTFYYLDFLYGNSGLNNVVVDVLLPTTNEAIIRVINYSYSSIYDDSDAPFSIVNPSLLIIKPVYLEYNFQNLPLLVAWLRENPETVVDVFLSMDDGFTWSLVGEDIDATEYTFTAPSQSSSNARVKIVNIADTTDFAVSEQFYIFPEPTVTLLAPNGGEVWNYFDFYAPLEWSGTNLMSYVNFYYSVDDGQNWVYLTSSYSDPNGGSTTTDIPFVETSNARIKIVDGSGIEDISDNPFSIVIPPINVYYPKDDYVYFAGGDLYITWWSFDVDLVRIELSTDNGQSFSVIAEDVNAALQSYNYEIPLTTFAEQCVIKVSNQNDPSEFDFSDVFDILPPPVITITTPNGGELWNTSTEYEIEWTYDNMVYEYTNIWLEFSPDNGLTWQYIGSVYQYGQSNSYTWVSPADESDECLFRITDGYFYSISDQSDATFSVKNIPQTPICMVSVDQELGKNIVVWEPVESDLISEYVVYRETNQSNVYQEIGSVGQDDPTMFIDENSTPMVQASRYKLGFRDAQGNEYPKSDFHQTIHLTISPGTGNNWNLIWSPYLGFEVQSYNIYRGYALGEMELIATVSGSFSSYTDFGATSDEVFYMVEVISPDVCNPQSPVSGFDSFNSVTSNIAANYLTSTGNELTESNFLMYPVPASETVNIELENPTKGIIVVNVLNRLGQVVKSAEMISDDPAPRIVLDVSGLNSGIYVLSVTDSGKTRTQKLVIEN